MDVDARRGISIVIRTLNEAQYLGELLESIQNQVTDSDVEVVIVDSGSTDETLEIARHYQGKIVHIVKEEFSFGRSLNVGCASSGGEILVFISGHCIPCNNYWLHNLTQPIRRDDATYAYGRQVGSGSTKYSESELFAKYFPARQASTDHVAKFFVNNANAAISYSGWERLLFNEYLTGLEDMEMAKRLLESGGQTLYCPDANVFHIHDETWHQTRRRYEREALALRAIMPEIHVRFSDALRYYLTAVFHDFNKALTEGVWLKEWVGILKFRAAQFWGGYRGNQLHRMESHEKRERYFYPKPK